MDDLKSNLTVKGKKILNKRRAWLQKALSYKILRIDGNPESHSSTVNILLFPINEIHWNVESIINILLKPALKKRKGKKSYKTKSIH
jgi:hypothetical protein